MEVCKSEINPESSIENCGFYAEKICQMARPKPAIKKSQLKKTRCESLRELQKPTLSLEKVISIDPELSILIYLN